MPRIEGDFAALLHAVATGAEFAAPPLSPQIGHDRGRRRQRLSRQPRPAAASIDGIEAAERDHGRYRVPRRHRAHRRRSLVAGGGRVLAVTAVADTLATPAPAPIAAIDAIDFADGFHRRDIGWRELERTCNEAQPGAGDRHCRDAWHRPGCGTGRAGAGERLRRRKSIGQMRATLDHYEMPAVSATLQRAPLTRRLLLAGPADDFQRSRDQAHVGWNCPASPKRLGTLNAAALASCFHCSPRSMLMALASFAIGAILAYVAALRRRAREAILA